MTLFTIVLGQSLNYCHYTSPFPFPMTSSSPKSSKTPLPRMSLRVRDKESQRHPGRPDQPRSKRTTQEVQAEKAEKIRVQTEREDLRAQNIQAAARVETQMGVQLQEKLAAAHHPPPSTQKKVLRPQHIKTLGAAPNTAKGKSISHTGTPVERRTQHTQTTELETWRKMSPVSRMCQATAVTSMTQTEETRRPKENLKTTTRTRKMSLMIPVKLKDQRWRRKKEKRSLAVGNFGWPSSPHKASKFWVT